MNLKNIKLKKMIYSASLAVYLAVAIAVFVFAAKFLGGSINEMFIFDESVIDSRLAKVDMEGFGIVKKKIEAQAPLIPATVEVSAATSSVSVVATSTATSTKKALPKNTKTIKNNKK